jgi:hypothetical protein
MSSLRTASTHNSRVGKSRCTDEVWIPAVERRGCTALLGEAEVFNAPELSEVARLIEAVERRGCEAILGEAGDVTNPPALSEAAGLLAAVERPSCEAVLEELGESLWALLERMVKTAPLQEQVHQSSCREV